MIRYEIQAALIVLFMVLWYSNSYICTYFHPYDANDQSTYVYFERWYYLRDMIYEAMFFVGVGAIIFKPTTLSKTVARFGFVVIGASVMDKWFEGVFDYAWYDPLVWVVGAAYAFKYYWNEKTK